ncbi:MAG: hypothetical protein KatS3mg038_3578 [Candidatus Kapaibacterium sp.]|nr:MAG: hypothetical protein KatS3mg038_3578 [Candidatus Kapabacteria bacterium]
MQCQRPRAEPLDHGDSIAMQYRVLHHRLAHRACRDSRRRLNVEQPPSSITTHQHTLTFRGSHELERQRCNISGDLRYALP